MWWGPVCKSGNSSYCRWSRVEKRIKTELNWIRVWLKCVFSSEAHTDGVVISPGGRSLDFKPAENQVNVWIHSQLPSPSNSWPSERPHCCVSKSGIKVFLLWRRRNARPHAGMTQMCHVCSSESTQAWKVGLQTLRFSTPSSCSLSSSRSAEVSKERCCCAEPPRPTFTIWWRLVSLNR